LNTNYGFLPAFTKIPGWLQLYNKDICWKIADNERNVYLTFDDGPHPVITPVILDILKEYHVKATFFCIGKNVEEHPTIFQRILDEGHTTGNHSYSHRSGWKLPIDEYVKDVNKAAEFITSPLFRPPYGRITPFQIKVLKGRYKIIMWDVLSKDYDLTVSDEEVIRNVTSNVSAGSIIIMHDNDKTVTRMQKILVPVIVELIADGWNFKLLSPD
jgi:peptidoglycan/xylan/chitin deacetylase (PgdA/CDA1 family)